MAGEKEAAGGINPGLYAVTAGAGVLSSIIGAILQNNELKRARQEARRIDERNWEEQIRMNRFAEKESLAARGLRKEELGLAKARFGLEAMATGAALKQAEVQKLENLVNNNLALRQSVLRNWSV